MKKLVLILIMVFSITYSFGQENNSTKMMEGYNYKDALTLESLKTKIDYTNVCLYEFRKQSRQGFYWQLSGIVLITMPLTGDAIKPLFDNAINNDVREIYAIASIVGGVCMLIGTVQQIDKYKWLKRAYIGRKEIGVGIPLNTKLFRTN